MKTSHHFLDLATQENVQIIDITARLQDLIDSAKINSGILVISSLHTTVSIGVNENEPRLLEDMAVFFEKLAPSYETYQHNDIHLRDCPPDEPENAHAHLIAMCMGNSESFAINEGKLVLGTYQAVLAIEMDGPRERKFSVQIIGE